RVTDGVAVDTLFPFGDFEDLLINWPVSYTLNQNKYTTPVMQRMAETDEAAQKFRRLYDLIKQNYSYQVFEAIKAFKAELSVQQSAVLDIPELDIEVELERWEFELMISDLLFELEQAITLILNKANLCSDDIDLVLRTGGSSLIPAVKDILDNQFAGKVVKHDPFTSVAAGLAIADFYGYGDK
ncbi:MAG: Hsp70 family protein, partial [Porticoccaceae bacterium]